MAKRYEILDEAWDMWSRISSPQAALMELTLVAEKQGLAEVGDNVRDALWSIGENAGHIKQGLAKLKGKSVG